MTIPKGMPADHFDTHLLPIDRVAAFSVSDEPYWHRVFTDFMEKAKGQIFEAPNIGFITNQRCLKKSSRIHNMIGRKFGTLTVIGHAETRRGPNNNKNVQKWWCRCKCGLFVVRKTSAIKRAADYSTCPWCSYVASLKRRLQSS